MERKSIGRLFVLATMCLFLAGMTVSTGYAQWWLSSSSTSGSSSTSTSSGWWSSTSSSSSSSTSSTSSTSTSGWWSSTSSTSSSSTSSSTSTSSSSGFGPAPTSSGLNGDGSYAVSSTTVYYASGFGGGTIYYPSTAGSYGVIVVCPGIGVQKSTISWFAKRLATYGFVTMAMDARSTTDNASSRATQMSKALNYLINSANSTVRSRIDSSRRGVAGHSMGGGGALIALKNDPTLKVGIAMMPGGEVFDFSSVTVPTFIFAADGDTTCSPSIYAEPYYESITNAEKAYALLNNATHITANTTDERIGRYGVAFAMRWMYGDTRYNEFLCGAAHASYATSSKFADYMGTCPY